MKGTSCRLFLVLLGLVFTTIQAHAVIDMRNANFSESWLDWSSQTGGYDLKINRTYNSRSLFSGMFGFGWCTEFETKLRVSVGNTLRVTDCGGGSETEFTSGHQVLTSADKSIPNIMAQVRKRNPGKDESYFKSIESQLKIDPDLRDEMARQLHMKMDIAKNAKYFAEGRASDTIVFNGSTYVRSTVGGSTQTFNKEGNLIKIADHNGNWIKINYRDHKISDVVDNTGAAIQFHYKLGTHFVQKATGPHGLWSKYAYRGENLIMASSAKQTFHYDYDNLNNMTKATFPDGTSIAMTYNQDRDWVTSFRDRRNCLEKYDYETVPHNLNHYGSLVVKTCHGKVTNRSKFEFWYEKSKSGERYLAKTSAEVNGHATVTLYHPVFGRPTEIRNGNDVTKFDYFADGRLKSKQEGPLYQTFAYHDSCNKLSEIVAKLNVREPSSGKNHIKTIITEFNYDPHRCNLSTVKNSDGQFAQLTYDMLGRIKKIVDQSKKSVLITYDPRFGKPSIVTRPGLGTIRFKYKNDGTMDHLIMKKNENPIVALQVADIFNNLLQLIAPASTDGTSI